METKVCGKCKETKSVSEFARKYDKYTSKCKKCHSEYQRNYWKYTPAYEKHKARVRANRSVPRERARQYGITIEQYTAGRAGLCNLCNNKQACAVDHDHSCCPGKSSCGKCVRGFLCAGCNSALGMLGDNLDGVMRAVIYLQRSADIN